VEFRRRPAAWWQECGAGLVHIKHDGGRLAFAAPPLTRFGPVDGPTRGQLAAALRLAPEDILDASWLVNGPEWIGVLLASAGQVLALEPDLALMGDLKVGVGPRTGRVRMPTLRSAPSFPGMPWWRIPLPAASMRVQRNG
jgi:predicted PhzF superfamily epimerase YddE/YHI9